jgi:hypothetical protein
MLITVVVVVVVVVVGQRHEVQDIYIYDEYT